MTGMYLILFHDLMSLMLGDITINFLMISYFYDITISWHHNLYGLRIYIFDPYKKICSVLSFKSLHECNVPRFFCLKYIYTRIQLLRLFVKKLLNSQWFIW